jgi:uncharacterized protein (TIGR02757 family)
MDPLGLVRNYCDPKDQEIAGLIAAFLALGRVELIRESVRKVLELFGRSPHVFVLNYDPERDRDSFRPFVYRFYRGEDLERLVWWLQRVLEADKTVERFFLRYYQTEDPDIGSSLSRFVRAVLSLPPHPLYPEVPPKGSGIRHFFADPRDGSGCKRLNLFLRWMVRRDTLDLGLWCKVNPSKLIIPLDVHIARLGSKLGLTKRKSVDWKMALEITESLRQFDADDPVRYDFALCKVGMLYSCPDRFDPSRCSDCPLVSCCKVHF